MLAPTECNQTGLAPSFLTEIDRLISQAVISRIAVAIQKTNVLLPTETA